MKTIFKYKLNLHEPSIRMPIGAQILSVQNQDGICIWAEVDPNADLENRQFDVIGTGQLVGKDLNYKFLATVQFHGGSLVVHVYEQINRGNF